jgi:hypothetical protein
MICTYMNPAHYRGWTCLALFLELFLALDNHMASAHARASCMSLGAGMVKVLILAVFFCQYELAMPFLKVATSASLIFKGLLQQI